MILRSAFLALLLAGVILVSAQEKAVEQPQILRPAKQARAPSRALAWSLLVDSLDKVPGNAAPMWIRAGMAGQNVRHKWTEQEYRWNSPEEVSLKALPLKDVRVLLDKHDTALRLARRAALRSRCDWEYPPLTIQTLGEDHLADVQMLRHLIRLLSLRCRLHLAEDNFDEAIKDLQVGLALARDTAGNQTLIQDLVAIALAQIMLARVEEWIQQPGSPNLYWPLTELPRPPIDVRRSMRSEFGTIYRSFPALRDLKAKKLTAEAANALVSQVFETFLKLAGDDGPEWKRKLATTALALKHYAAAKKGLLERGRSEKEVEALPVAQAVALYHLEEYDRACDEYIKCVTLPSWQAYPEMEKFDRVEKRKSSESGNLFVSLLLPAMTKVFQAQMRLDRNLAGLRTAEAIRLHIARHGSPPAKLADLTEAPLPIDPFTGKNMAAWYTVKDGKAILDVPPPPGQSARLGKRYEYPLQPR